MNKKEILEKIKEKKSLIKLNGVKRLGLFGSYLKGKQTKKSDIDFLVTFDSPTFDKYADTLILLEKIFKKKIDLVMEKNLRPELNYVKKEAEYVRI